MNIPKGFKVVPEVATLEMKNAGWRECGRQGIEPESIEMQTIWTAMHLEATAPPKSIYDEAAEQKAFEAVNPMPDQVTKFKGGYAPTGYSAWDAQDFCKKWDGWKQCAQSRAKAGEDE